MGAGASSKKAESIKAAVEAGSAEQKTGSAAEQGPGNPPALEAGNLATTVVVAANKLRPSSQRSSNSKGPPPTVKTDGESSASKVVGSARAKPKAPSPDDDRVLEEWKAAGKLHVFEGVWCAVPYKVMAVPAEGVGDAASTYKLALDTLNAVAAEVEAIFSHFVETSEVSTINMLDADVVHKPSPSMQKVLALVAQLNRMTRGVFDPAVKPLSDHYRLQLQDGEDPEIGRKDVAAYAKWAMFELSDDGLKKLYDCAELDLTGLAKGWAIDEMVDRLKAAGFTASFVDWGGDIKVSGMHPAGRNWNAAIVEPPAYENIGAKALDGEKQYVAHIELRDGQSIATSGDYLQTLGRGHSHVIDARKGTAVKITGESCASASVVASSCMLADGLATAALAAGDVKAGRILLDTFSSGSLKDPVLDYLLYSRDGPRVVRRREASAELPEHSEDRRSRHDPAHVIVIGGGLAGVSAAIEACNARAKVTLIEKEANIGGNSAKATSGINACGTRVQKSQGVDDAGCYFERDTHVSGKGGHNDLGCVTVLSERSAQGIHWLMDEMGVPLTALSQLGGHSKKRTHRVPPRSDGVPVPVGYTIMQHARLAVEAMEGVEVKTSCKVRKLVWETGENDFVEVKGVEYEDATGSVSALMADAVIVTTGGFGFDHSEGSLMRKYRPDLVGVPTTNGAFTSGDGINFGSDLGANLIDMDKVQLHPTAFIDPADPGNHTKYLGPEALRGSGGILLDQQGRRFVNELDLRSVVSGKILEHCDPYTMPDGTKGRAWAWCLLNQEAQEKFGRPMLNFYKDQVGLFEAAEDIKGLASLIGCDESNIIETFQEYAAACDQEICARTGKVVFPSKVCENDRNFIVGRITPCIHYCMGGLEISSAGEVLTKAKIGAMGRRIKVRRLFAAGECTGGVHGGNRLGGNSLLECVVFGRLAGERAATIKQTTPTLLDKGDWVPVTLREVRSTDAKYGYNTMVYRFNLHGTLQTTGLEVGRFVAIRGELDGDTLTGYYSPISRPEDEGIIDILCRVDDKGGPIVQFLDSIRPGASCLMKGMGGVRLVRQPNGCWTHQDRNIQRLSLLCGGTGFAPAMQISRAYINAIENYAESYKPGGGIRVVYAAEAAGDLAFFTYLEHLKERYPKLISYYLVLNRPPAGWTGGIGFVDNDIIRKNLWFPPSDDHMLVMCGPPIFEKIMCGNLAKLGYPNEQYYSFAADPEAIG